MVISCCSLHLRSIVSVAKLSEAETAHVFQAVDVLHYWQVTIRVQSHKCAAEKVELDSELSRKITIDVTEHLVCGENVLWVILKIEYGDQFLVTYPLDPCVG